MPSCGAVRGTAWGDTQSPLSSVTVRRVKRCFSLVSSTWQAEHVFPIEPGRHSWLSPENPNGLILISLWKTMKLEHVCYDLQFSRFSASLVVSGVVCLCSPPQRGDGSLMWQLLGTVTFSPWPQALRESDHLGWWHFVDIRCPLTQPLNNVDTKGETVTKSFSIILSGLFALCMSLI